MGILRNADYLLQLMKQQIDRLVAGDSQLQAFLMWAKQKSRAVTAPYKPVAVRAFYLALARTLVLVSDKLDLARALAFAGDTLEIAFSLDPTFALNRSYAIDLNVDRALVLALARAIDLGRVPTVDLGLKSFFVFARALVPELELEVMPYALLQSLLPLKNQLPAPDEDKERLEEWWQAFGGAWTEQLKAVMSSCRNIGHDWQFSDQQKETLRQYYDTNRLLVDCLNNDSYVTRAVREEIEETLLLPVVEI
jgi:predicted NACHT family NTPase